MMRSKVLCGVAFAVISSAAAADITTDPVIQSTMLTSEAAARVIVGCPSIGMDAGAMAKLVEDMTAHVETEGYATNEAALLQDEGFRGRIKASIDAFITSEGFDPETEAGLCAFGDSEIAKASQIGQMLSK